MMGLRKAQIPADIPAMKYHIAGEAVTWWEGVTAGLQDGLHMRVTPSAERDELNRLLQHTGRNDQKAFAELYKRTSSKLFGVCLRMLRDRSEAEEALQETFTAVWRRAASFDATRASAITWLVTLSRNKAIDRLRQRREVLLDDPKNLDIVVDEEAAPAADAETSQEYVRLRQCLDELEPQQQSSIREAFFTGATYNELAARCKVPLGTMKSWIRRALIQLRQCLDQ
jgi:RNA polymerase sigma-70 factor (ECF subfamily)